MAVEFLTTWSYSSFMGIGKALNAASVPALSKHQFRQGASSIRTSDDYTIESQRSPSFVKLLRSAKTTKQLSDVSGHLLPQGHSSRHEKLPKKRFLPSGWRTGALVSLIGAVVVFVFNLGITIWVWANPSFQANGAVGTMYRGNCAVVRNMNVKIHLLVNVSYLFASETILLTTQQGSQYHAAVR